MTFPHAGTRAGDDTSFRGVSMGPVTDPLSPVPPREIYHLTTGDLVLASVGMKTCSAIGEPVSPLAARDMARQILAHATAATPTVLMQLALALEAMWREREASSTQAMELV